MVVKFSSVKSVRKACYAGNLESKANKKQRELVHGNIRIEKRSRGAKGMENGNNIELYNIFVKNIFEDISIVWFRTR